MADVPVQAKGFMITFLQATHHLAYRLRMIHMRNQQGVIGINHHQVSDPDSRYQTSVTLDKGVVTIDENRIAHCPVIISIRCDQRP